MKKINMMIGTSLAAQGGVSSVVNVLKEAGLFDRAAIEYVSTHCDGAKFKKLSFFMKAWVNFVWKIVFYKVGLLHVHMASRASFWRKTCFIVPAFICRVPVIIHLHGAEFHLFYERESSFLGRLIIKFIFEHVDRVVVLSDWWCNWVSSTFINSNVSVIYNPVVLPSQISTKRDDASLLFFGRVGERKGAFDLIKALVLVKQRFPAVRLYVGGDGDVAGANSLAADLGVSDNLVLLGWVVGADKQALLQKASIFVLPSYNEGLPMGILEAMASGLPVVTTPVGGIPNAISDSVEGYLIEPGDVDALAARLCDLLGNDFLRSQMGLAARDKCEKNFSVDVIIPKIEELYVEIAKGG